VTGIPHGDAPSLLNTSYAITAQVTIPPGGAEGMIHTNGGRFGGYGLYLLKSKPVFTWNLLDLKRVRWEAPEALSPGKHTIAFDSSYGGFAGHGCRPRNKSCSDKGSQQNSRVSE